MVVYVNTKIVNLIGYTFTTYDIDLFRKQGQWLLSCEKKATADPGDSTDLQIEARD